MYLLHSGLCREKEIISQHLFWTVIIPAVRKEVNQCDLIQSNKKANTKYVKITTKLVDDTLEKIVDLIGPYKIRRKGKDILILKEVTIIDPVTGCFEVTQHDDKKVTMIKNLVKTTWLSRYPCPS